MNTTNTATNNIFAELKSFAIAALEEAGVDDFATDLNKVDRLRAEARAKLTEIKNMRLSDMYQSQIEAEKALLSKAHGHIGNELGRDVLGSLFKLANNDDKAKSALRKVELETLKLLGKMEDWEKNQADLAECEAKSAQADELRASARLLFEEANRICRVHGWEETVEKKHSK